MTLVINLYGGPGTGKSTAAAHTFALFKQNGMSSELITEYVKQWAWENRKIVDFDQFYFFGKQARKEYSLYGKVDYLITDSPVALTGYYTSEFGSSSQSKCFDLMVQQFYQMAKEKEVNHVHVWLQRQKTYDPRGRFQTEQEALAMDISQKKYLNSLGISLVEVLANDEVAKFLLQLSGKF